MNKIIENTIEEYTINLFEKQGYKCIYAPSIAPDIKTDEPLRRHFICEILIHSDFLENQDSIKELILLDRSNVIKMINKSLIWREI